MSVPHPSEYIAEELEARGWSRSDLAERMNHSYAQTVLDIYFLIGPTKTNCRIGIRTAEALARAFDVSPEYFIALERDWLQSKGVEPPHD